MILRNLAAVAVFIGAGLAQDVSVTGNLGANNGTKDGGTPTEQYGNITIHYVDVGKANNNFQPNSINANPGDIVTFRFYPTAHSVIKAAYGYPCIPYEDLGLKGNTFYSGPMPVKTISDNPPTWNLTVNDTAPVFYYCGAPGSCIDWGMVGVINANGSTSIATQISLARQSDFQLLPGEPFPNEAQQASLDSLAATATTAVITVTATPADNTATASSTASSSHDDHHGGAGLSGGAIAGIAIGAAAVSIAICGIWFLLRRSRNLKKKLDASREQNQQMQQHQNQQGPFSPMAGSFVDSSRHTSALPPYHQGAPKYSSVAQEAKPHDDGGWATPPMASPYQNAGGFVPYGQDQRWTTMTSVTSTSELGGAQHPPSELAASHHDLDPHQRDYR